MRTMYPVKAHGVSTRQSLPTTSSFPVNAGDSTLPYIHDSFPPTAPKPRPENARYYTVTQRAERSPRDVLRPTLPELHLDKDKPPRRERRREQRDQGRTYISNHKAVMRLRGLTYSDLYCCTSTRSKGEIRLQGINSVGSPGSDEPIRARLASKRPLKDKAISEGSLEVGKEFRLPDIHSGRETQGVTSVVPINNKLFSEADAANQPEVGDPLTTARDSDDENSWREMDYCYVPQREPTLEQRLTDVVDEYKGTPGWTPKKRNFGRKLGNVVSSNRLSQLLESNEPLKMENFYNYYP